MALALLSSVFKKRENVCAANIVFSQVLKGSPELQKILGTENTVANYSTAFHFTNCLFFLFVVPDSRCSLFNFYYFLFFRCPFCHSTFSNMLLQKVHTYEATSHVSLLRGRIESSLLLSLYISILLFLCLSLRPFFLCALPYSLGPCFICYPTLASSFYYVEMKRLWLPFNMQKYMEMSFSLCSQQMIWQL